MEQDKFSKDDTAGSTPSPQDTVRDSDRLGNTYTEDRWYITSRNTVYYILGIIEVLLAFRLVFKLLGANTGNMFVDFLYSVTNIFIIPFAGIFRTLASQGDTSQFIFEPATVIAMIVYAIVARGIINLFRIRVTGKA